MPDVLNVELTRDELDQVVNLVRGRHLELERMLTNLEETEGLDATKFNVRRQLVPQIELFQDLLLKLEGAVKGKA